MRTEQVIADLVSRATPVRPLPAPGIRALAWAAIAAACACAGVAIFGVKPDIDVVVRDPEFVWRAMAGVLTIAFAGASALVLAVPGAERTPVLRGSAIALVSVWALTLATSAIRAGDGFVAWSDGHWPICFARVAIVALIPAIALTVMLRRAAPLHPRWTVALGMIAAMAAGAVATQIVCPVNGSAHALLGHFGPVIVFALFGAAAGRLLTSRS